MLGVALVVVVLAMSLIWTPAMALLSDNAEAAGLDLAFATALVSLAWAGGQVLGGSVFVALADATTDAIAYASSPRCSSPRRSLSSCERPGERRRQAAIRTVAMSFLRCSG